MADTTKIAWTDSTFNPWIGCAKVSEGCRNCYAERFVSGRMGRDAWGPKAERRRTSAAYWRQPHTWNRKAERDGVQRRVFCGSLCDVFEDRPDLAPIRTDLWELIRSTPALDWLLLTKRPENIRSMLPAGWWARESGYPNVWLGTTVESPEVAHRIAPLAVIPAAVRFLSVEPMIGPVRLDPRSCISRRIDWVIVGGESGPSYRNWSVQWVRDLRADCERNGTAFFFKQSPGPSPGHGETLDGEIVRKLPTPRPQL